MVNRFSLSRTALRLLLLGLILSPIALAVAARTADASGYVVAYDGFGNPTCTPGGNDDCPT